MRMGDQNTRQGFLGCYVGHSNFDLIEVSGLQGMEIDRGVGDNGGRP